MKKIFSVLAAIGFALTATTAMAAVTGTPHEYGGTAAYGKCEICHIPHAAQGSKRLWRNRPQAALSGTHDWTTSTVGYLCGDCHNGGTLAAYPNANSCAPVSQASTVYVMGAAHGRQWSNLTNAPSAGGVGDTPIDATANGKPYIGSYASQPEPGYMECTSCHNPHEDGLRPFLRPGSATNSSTTISGFCADCHHERYNTAVYVNVTSSKMHPVNIPYANNPNNDPLVTEVNYFQATPNSALITLVNPLNSGSGVDAWPLGGKFEGALEAAPGGGWSTADIGCGTCHAIHNPATTTVAEYQGLYLLAIYNNGNSALLCQGCHGGPATGTTVGTGPDHPIDMQPGTGGGPTIDKWFNTDGSTKRYERGSKRDNFWPVGGDDNTTPGNIICVSCHSAHNSGSEMGRLTRNLFTGYGAGVLFCQACHSDPSPAGHHSNEYNWAGPSNYNIGKTPSVLGINCFDCHGSGNSFGAHNGFSFTFDAASNQLSNLCTSCHLTDGLNSQRWDKDPATFTIAGGVQITNFPANHLGAYGTNITTHYLGSFTDGANSINVKRTTWTAGAASFSKYGADTHGAVTDTTGAGGVGKGQMVCESCHSVLHNAGAVQASPTASSGYMVNLLMQNYQDDSNNTAADRAVGSGFCVACHNQGGIDADGPVADTQIQNSAVAPLNMHPMTAWSITKAQDSGRTPTTLITGAGSYATAATGMATGGVLATGESYPGTNEMDCDSCHRPHKASIAGGGTYTGTKAGGVNPRPVILENAGPGAGEFDQLCLDCHAY